MFAKRIQEMAAIPGADHLKSVDTMGLQVCVRRGTQLVIHPDQIKQWTNSGQELADAFQKLKEHHDAKYMNALSSIIQAPAASSNQTGSAVVAAVVADETAEGEAENQDPGASGGSGPSPEKVTFESFDKLNQEDPIETRCASEVSGIELLLGKSGKVYICSDKDKVVPKFSVLGGFGTGKHFA